MKSNKLTYSQISIWFGLFLYLISSLLFYVFYVKNYSLTVKTSYFLVSVAITVALFFLTEASKKLKVFLSETKFELKKVTWPTRQETLQTTFIVLGFALLISIFLWIVDSTLLYCITLFTGQS